MPPGGKGVPPKWQWRWKPREWAPSPAAGASRGRSGLVGHHAPAPAAAPGEASRGGAGCSGRLWRGEKPPHPDPHQTRDCWAAPFLAGPGFSTPAGSPLPPRPAAGSGGWTQGTWLGVRAERTPVPARSPGAGPSPRWPRPRGQREGGRAGGAGGGGAGEGVARGRAAAGRRGSAGFRAAAAAGAARCASGRRACAGPARTGCSGSRRRRAGRWAGCCAGWAPGWGNPGCRWSPTPPTPLTPSPWTPPWTPAPARAPPRRAGAPLSSWT